MSDLEGEGWKGKIRRPFNCKNRPFHVVAKTARTVAKCSKILDEKCKCKKHAKSSKNANSDVLFLQRGCLSSRLSSLGKERISGNNDIPHWICTLWLFLDQH